MTIAEPRAKYGKRRRANLNPAFIKEMAAAVKMEFFEDGKGDLKKTFGPEDIFDYIYAVFHSPNYRKRYAEFLKSDFPRVPLPEDAKQFRRLTSLGGELVALHLMESPKLDKLITKYDTRGVHHVEQVRYVDTQKRVYINKEQFFEGMPKDVWEFQIGGYQVCEKWLKDRKGRELGVDEIKHYQRIVVALNETIRLMKEIDEVGLPGLTE
jgi:predicted helicase